jgi:predicted small lipoprotein YifL
MKKTLVLMMVMVIGLGGLTACGKKGEPEQPPPRNQTR